MSVPQVTDGGPSSFRCERGDQACKCTIRLTAAEYESVPAYATHFAIAPHDEDPQSEELIEEHERFAVVDTVSGEAANSPVEATCANGVGREIRLEASK